MRFVSERCGKPWRWKRTHSDHPKLATQNMDGGTESTSTFPYTILHLVRVVCKRHEWLRGCSCAVTCGRMDVMTPSVAHALNVSAAARTHTKGRWSPPAMTWALCGPAQDVDVVVRPGRRVVLLEDPCAVREPTQRFKDVVRLHEVGFSCAPE